MTHRGRSARAIPRPSPGYRSLRSLARRNPAKTDRRSESPISPPQRSLGLIPTPAQPGAGIPNGAVFPPQALVHSRIHPPAGAGSTGAAQPVPAGIPANVTPSPPPVNVATPENPLAASAPGDQVGILLQGAKRRKTQQPQRARDPADPPAVPAPRRAEPSPPSPTDANPSPDSDPSQPQIPSSSQPRIPPPSPPRPGSRPHIPRPDVAMGSRRRRDPARGVASIHRARDSSTLPRRGPHEHGCLLLHEPRGAMQSARAAQRSSGGSARARAHTELETERAARVQVESALAETRLKLLVFRRAERRAIGAIRDGVRAFANGAGERDGGSGKAPIRRRGSRGAERWGDDVHGALRVGVRARVHPTERLHGAPASTPGSETARHGSSARRPRRGSKDVLAHHRDVRGRRGGSRASARRGGAGSD